VGGPEAALPQTRALDLMLKGKSIGVSCIGSCRVIEEMLQLAAEKGANPWVKERPMPEANQAIVNLGKGCPGTGVLVH